MVGGCGKQEEIPSCPRGMKFTPDVRTTTGRGKSKVTEIIRRIN